MSALTVAETLRAALDLMNNKGDHWTQGQYADGHPEDPDTAFCSVGAINFIVTGDPDAGFNDPQVRRTISTLASVLTDVPMMTGTTTSTWKEFDYQVDRVIRWNDNGERNWEDIVQKFKEAAEKAES